MSAPDTRFVMSAMLSFAAWQPSSGLPPVPAPPSRLFSAGTPRGAYTIASPLQTANTFRKIGAGGQGSRTEAACEFRAQLQFVLGQRVLERLLVRVDRPELDALQAPGARPSPRGSAGRPLSAVRSEHRPHPKPYQQGRCVT